jgi:hypothetical protein
MQIVQKPAECAVRSYIVAIISQTPGSFSQNTQTYCRCGITATHPTFAALLGTNTSLSPLASTDDDPYTASSSVRRA